MSANLLIQGSGGLQSPSVEEGITWKTERKGFPGELNFKVLSGTGASFEEGDNVQFTFDGGKVFNGFIFNKSRDKSGIISVKAYDQLRYLKNKDTYVYENKTAGQFIKMLADDFHLQTGTLEDTGFVIESRVEENATLFDMIQNALDLTLQNKKEMYVLYDSFGRLTLRNLASMAVPIVIDEETGENFDYTSSIDQMTYNKIKLSYDNEKTGKREIYIAQDGSHINQWGVLQFYDKLQKGENGKAKADALLELYNKKTRNLSIKKAFGDTRVRAGSLVIVNLDLGDIRVNNRMLVEKCTHTFNEGEHWMDLTLRGGEFIA